MARFNLNKGDRFKLSKDAGLNNLQVHLSWDGDHDLDSSTFLLGEEGVINNDADFVFYNSENRQEPYDKAKHGAKRNYIATVRPMSADGSVLGSIDEVDGGGDGETIDICLDKVDAKIQEIVFVATVHGNETFGDVKDAAITLTNTDTGEELCRYALNEAFAAEDAAEIAKLFLNDEGEWEFEAVGVGHEGGLQTLIDLFT
ncbi:TerD family protein [Prevotellamassilia timonensis]|jgi:tellurium resistance protein TerD|uniref:TerD family protein n=1 Tax=Prevotellamassilia timonensis TaxID=1852370 RepID=UPI00258D835F|nr:TerD family protein [uncultured Prevotellamassilia sp.]